MSDFDKGNHSTKHMDIKPKIPRNLIFKESMRVPCLYLGAVLFERSCPYMIIHVHTIAG